MNPFSMTGGLDVGGDLIPDLSSSATGGTQGGANVGTGPRTVIGGRVSSDAGQSLQGGGISPLMVAGGAVVAGVAVWLGTRL